VLVSIGQGVSHISKDSHRFGDGLPLGPATRAGMGIDLQVTPHFLDEETVQIQVHAKRSYIETQDEKLGFTVFSQTANTEVDANAVLRFGETLILSGLSES